MKSDFARRAFHEINKGRVNSGCPDTEARFVEYERMQLDAIGRLERDIAAITEALDTLPAEWSLVGGLDDNGKMEAKPQAMPGRLDDYVHHLIYHLEKHLELHVCIPCNIYSVYRLDDPLDAQSRKIHWINSGIAPWFVLYSQETDRETQRQIELIRGSITCIDVWSALIKAIAETPVIGRVWECGMSEHMHHLRRDIVEGQLARLSVRDRERYEKIVARDKEIAERTRRYIKQQRPQVARHHEQQLGLF